MTADEEVEKLFDSIEVIDIESMEAEDLRIELYKFLETVTKHYIESGKIADGLILKRYGLEYDWSKLRNTRK